MLWMLSLSLAQPAPDSPESSVQDSEALLAAGHRRYGPEHGRITYTVSGAGSGTQTMVWDRHGWREAQRMSVSFEALGQVIEQDSRAWVDGGWMYVQRTPEEVLRMAHPELAAIPAEPVMDPSTTLPGAEATGTDEVLGRTCTVYTAPTGTACIWEGVLLRSAAAEGGISLQLVATALDVEGPVTTAEVALPTGMAVTDLTAAVD